MKQINENTALMAIAARQGMEMSVVEAAIILGYLDGHDYALMGDEHFQMKLHDQQDGDDHSKDEPYSVREAIEFCVEMNEELLTDAQTASNRDDHNILDLEKDAYILEEIMQRASKVIPPVLRNYKVAIVQTLRRVVSVRAASWAEAEEQVKQSWEDGEQVLTAEDFAGIFFTAGEV